MDNELRRKLQDCLREVESTGDIEAALRRFPRDAEALRPYLEFAASLGSQAASPAEADRLAGRQRLLSEIANLDQRERGIGHMTIFGQKLLPIAGAVLGAVFLVGGMAGAAALPGSPVPAPLPFVPHSSGVQNAGTEHEGCETAEANDDDANSEPSEDDCATPTPVATPAETPAETPAASPEDQNDDNQGQEGDDQNESATPAPDNQHEGDSNEGIQPGVTPGAGDDHESAAATPSATQQPEGDHSSDSNSTTSGGTSSDGGDRSN